MTKREHPAEERTNRYAARCAKCGNMVKAGEGTTAKIMGTTKGWRTEHRVQHPGAISGDDSPVLRRSISERFLRSRQMTPQERNAVIEECAAVCDAEAKLRRERMDGNDPNWPDKMAQGHKSVTAMGLAGDLRDLKTPI